MNGTYQVKTKQFPLQLSAAKPFTNPKDPHSQMQLFTWAQEK